MDEHTLIEFLVSRIRYYNDEMEHTMDRIMDIAKRAEEGIDTGSSQSRITLLLDVHHDASTSLSAYLDVLSQLGTFETGD